MATTGAQIEAVGLTPAPLERYRDLLSGGDWRKFCKAMKAFAATMRGRTVWNVNSTARGGGVAELLGALIPYDMAAGVDERWVVIAGSPGFFDVTKKIHTLLHGVSPDGPDLLPTEREVYERTLAPNATSLLELMRPGDVAVLHDPQTLGLVPALAAHGVKVVWRCHIGVDEPNDIVRGAWRFLTPYLESASGLVFSRSAYVWDSLEPSRVSIIPPCIDPFTTKNRELDPGEVKEVIAKSGVLAEVPDSAQVVVQVSRWDRLKDPAGVMQAFGAFIAPASDAWLVLAGPQVTSVDDDPEQPKILAEVEAARSILDGSVARRAIFAQIPMTDLDENALIVNALQQRAEVVVQKSLAEGFGLTVAEAMWKARPVVASRVGGISDQIEDGRSGMLIDDPRDLPAFGAAVVDLLRDRKRARRLGTHAKRRVAREFLAPRHLMRQAELLSSLV